MADIDQNILPCQNNHHQQQVCCAAALSEACFSAVALMQKQLFGVQWETCHRHADTVL